LTDRTDRILERLLTYNEKRAASRAAMSKRRAKNPELEAEQLIAKYDFAAKLDALELSNYDAAELFSVNECHVRAWRDTRDMKRHPPAHAIRRLQKLIEARATFSSLRRVGT